MNKYNDDPNDSYADNIYYNVRINNSGKSGFSFLANYDVTKDQPIINNCKDYYV